MTPSKPASKPKALAANPARAFADRIKAMQSDDELRKTQRYFKSGEGEYGHGDTFIGVRMGSIFALAKEFVRSSRRRTSRHCWRATSTNCVSAH